MTRRTVRPPRPRRPRARPALVGRDAPVRRAAQAASPALAALALMAALIAVAPAAMAAEDYGLLEEGTATLEPVVGLKHPPTTSLKKGDALTYDWEVVSPAGAELFFSTHLHIGSQLVNITEDVASAKEGSMVADRDGLYSVLWENHGNDSVTFRFRYSSEAGEAEPAGGGNATPLGSLPALAALGVAAAAGAMVRARRRS